MCAPGSLRALIVSAEGSVEKRAASLERGCALPDADVMLPVLPSTLKGDLRKQSFCARNPRGWHAVLPSCWISGGGPA